MTLPTCYHTNKRIVWTSVGADDTPLAMRQLRHQCADCGRLLASALPHSMASPNTPQVDREALRGWIRHDREQWSRHRSESFEREQQRKLEWRDRYEKYLMSDKWALLREKVFERAGGVCEGCRAKKATAVHHLSYDHVGDELLWELAAVCRECHENAHGIGDPSRSRNYDEVRARRSLLHDLSPVFREAEKAASEAAMSWRDDQCEGRDVGMQSLRMGRR